jgi:hypothetical protein
MRQHKLFLIALTGVAALAVLAGLEWFPAPRQPEPRGPVEQNPVISFRPVRERADFLLQKAEADSLERIAVALQALEALFAQARERTPRFAEEVLSLQGKWSWISGRQEDFVRRAFEQHLFTPDQLAQAVEQVVQAYLADLNRIDNEMLVQLREDLADLPEAAWPGGLNPGRLREGFDAAVRQTVQQGQTQVRAELGVDLARLIASEVLATLAVRMTVSGGVVGAGAGTSWATLGVGLVVGLILDQILSLAWNWIVEPEAKLAGMVRERLNELQGRLVNGNGSAPGLRDRLEQLARDRDAVRRQAVLDMVPGSEGGPP